MIGIIKASQDMYLLSDSQSTVIYCLALINKVVEHDLEGHRLSKLERMQLACNQALSLGNLTLSHSLLIWEIITNPHLCNPAHPGIFWSMQRRLDVAVPFYFAREEGSSHLLALILCGWVTKLPNGQHPYAYLDNLLKSTTDLSCIEGLYDALGQRVPLHSKTTGKILSQKEYAEEVFRELVGKGADFSGS